MDDLSRPAATDRDTHYTLSIDAAADLYARAGHPRTPRSIQRYCASGHLESIKMATALGDKYFIEPASIARHISQIEELIALEDRASGRDAPRPVGSNVARQYHDNSGATPLRDSNDRSRSVATAAPEQLQHSQSDDNDRHRQSASTVEATSRPDATATIDVSRYVERLEREVERAVEDRAFLRGQIKTKDEQIAALLERDKETNFLVRGLQQMLSPLLGAPRHTTDPLKDDFDQ